MSAPQQPAAPVILGGAGPFKKIVGKNTSQV
jgi:hypothetical protein